MKEIFRAKNKLAIVLFVLIGLSLFFYIDGIWWGLPSWEGWAPDELVPSEILKGIDVGFAKGWFDKYPPFHYYVLTFFYSPLLMLQSLNILNFEKLQDYALLIYVGRFVSVMMACGIVFLVYAVGREIYDVKSSILAAAIAAFICPLLYYAKTTNLEVPYIFWMVFSLWFYIRILKYHKFKDYIGFTITAVFSICTKDQAYAFYVLTPLFIINHHYTCQKLHNKQAKLNDSFKDKKVVFSLFLGLALFIGLHNLLFNITGFAAHVKLITGGAKSTPQFEMSLLGQLQMLWHSLSVQTRFAFGWPMYIVCLLGIFSHFLKTKANQLLTYLLIPAVSYYLFYVLLMGSNDVRFLLPLFIIFSWFGGQFLSDFLNYKQFYKSKAILIIALFTYTILYSSSLNLLMVQDSRYYVESWMSKQIDDKALVLGVSNSSKYLPRNGKYQVVNMQRPSLDEFLKINPNYVIITSAYDGRRFKENSKEFKFFSKLNNGEIGYKMIFNYRSYPNGILLDYEELLYRDRKRRYIYSNFDKINPEIKIFKKM